MPSKPVSLIWVKSSSTTWCRLMDLNLSLIRTYGVYVIWHSGHPGRVIQVGHGDIATELAASRADPAVTGYFQNGSLMVTWAAAAAAAAAGIGLHLSDTLRPLIADRGASDVVAISANGPF